MRLAENAIHCVSIFLIKRLSVDSLVNMIKKNSIRPAEECRASIKSYFNKKGSGGDAAISASAGADDDDEICIDSLSVPLTCSLDMKLI